MLEITKFNRSFVICFSKLFSVLQYQKTITTFSICLVLYIHPSYAYGSVVFLPLYCDPDAVKLEDPVLNNLIYPNNYVERDLFFSGHAIMMLSFYWGFKNSTIKRVYLVGAVVVSTLLVIQKVHFTIDVLAAPLFSYISIWLADWVIKKTSNKVNLNAV